MIRTTVYESLVALGERHGPRERGKLCQKLLAIAFRTTGCNKITERGVQGVDVDACHVDGRKYSIEVKTTEGDYVPIGAKDLSGLRQRASQDGYEPMLGVLRIGLFSEWFLTTAASLKTGRVLIDSLRPLRVKELEAVIQPAFDAAICEHIGGALDQSQAYLDAVLRKHDILVQE